MGSGPTTRKADPSIAPLHPTLEPPDIKSFREWNLGEELQGAIESMGITTPTPIQRLAIQPVLDGRDVIAKAETGTGKTLAFGAPMMAKVDPARASVLGLVLCPTRELAEQGQKVLEILGKPRGVKVALVVGGEPLEPQVAALKGGAQVVVGTPGRILDLYKQRFLSFPWTEFAILDEADVMLEIGFIDDVKQILSYMPDERQTLLFSATFPPELLKLAREYTKNPVEVATASGVSTVTNITQTWIPVEEDDRSLALIRLIEQSAPEDIFLVFCDRRTEVDKLMRRLERLPFSIKALHGGYDQAARFRVMSAFRTGEVKVLVATDVASRGLDVAHVTTVVNYSSPHDITDYTHRIGRTGRAGRKGRAITLVGGMDMRKWRPIQRDATWDIPQAEIPGPSRGPSGSRGAGSSRDSGFSRGGPRRDAPREERVERVEEPIGEPRRESPRADRPRDDVPRRESTRDERPRREEREARPARDDRRGASFAPRRDDSLVPPPDASGRWPVDEDAASEAARHRDLRPNRASPRAGRPEPRHRDAPREERAAPRRDESSSTERAPRRESSAHRDAPARREDTPRRGAEPRREESPRRSDADRPSPRDERAPRRDDREAGGARRESPPAREPRRSEPGAPRVARDESRGPARAETRAPRHEERSAPRAERAPAPRSEGERAPRRHADERAPRSDSPRAGSPRAESPRSESPRSESPRRDSPRAGSMRAESPRAEASDRSERPRRAAPGARSTPPPELEERPPGTFERPMSGGLLGHAARRPVAGRPTSGDSSRRPRRGRDR